MGTKPRNSIKINTLPSMEDFSDYYYVTRSGKVWSTKSQRFRKPSATNSCGYHQLDLTRKSGKPKTVYVHHLVALMAYGRRPSGLQLRHKNGIRTDNRAANLEYCSRAKNTADRHKHGTFGRRLSKDKRIYLWLFGSVAEPKGLSFTKLSKVVRATPATAARYRNGGKKAICSELKNCDMIMASYPSGKVSRLRL